MYFHEKNLEITLVVELPDIGSEDSIVKEAFLEAAQDLKKKRIIVEKPNLLPSEHFHASWLPVRLLGKPMDSKFIIEKD